MCLVQYKATVNTIKTIWILHVLVAEKDDANSVANVQEYTTSVVDAVLSPENLPDMSSRKFDYYYPP